MPDTTEEFTDPEYLLAPEFNKKLTHIYGAVGAGRDNNPKMNSARCQFYIVQNKNGLHRLNNKYTIFGQVIKGMNVVEKIVNTQKDSVDKPLTPITLDINIIKIKEKDLKKITPFFLRNSILK